MKCKVLWVFVLGAMLLLFTWMDSSAQALRIMPLGNSITEGTEGIPISEGQRIGYRYTLYTLLTGAGYDFNFVGHASTGYEVFPDSEHAGIPGSRDQYLLRLLQDGYDLRWEQQITPGGQPYLDVYPADLILLHIGTNDITHGEGASPAYVSLILDEIDAWENRSGTDATVIVARIINRNPYSLTTSQYNNNVAAMVTARNDPSIVMVDIENGAGINYSTEIYGDGIHPRPSAYAKMGEKWFQAIQALNEPPYFTSVPVTSAAEDMAYSYSVTVNDENPLDQLTLLAATKPGWCTFTDNGDNTGLLSGTPGDGDVGPHPVSLVVSDGKTLTTQNFTIQVSNEPDAPLITGQQSISMEEDATLLLTKDLFTIYDVDSDPADLSIVVENGDNYTHDANVISPDQDYFGTLQVAVRPMDDALSGPIFTAEVVVDPVNDPPVIHGQVATLNVKQFETLQLKVTDLYYTDFDNNVNDLEIVVTSNPGDLFVVNGNMIIPTADTAGSVPLGVVIYDGVDQSNEYQLQVNILSAYNPPEFITTPQTEATVGSAYFYVVGAADPDEGDELSYRSTILPDWLQFNATLKLLGGNPAIEDTGTVWVGIEVTDGLFRVEQLYQIEVKTPAMADGGILSTSVMSNKIIDQIYPVPARNMIHLRLQHSCEVQLEILDVTGKVHMQENLHGREFSLDLTGYKQGFYVIRVISGDSTDSRKFMVR